MTSSRRDFFRTTVVLPASWTAFAAAIKAAEPESYWQMVKRQFPLEEKLIYLNAANVCPASRPVMDRHVEYLRDFQANPSFQNRDKYVAMRESLRGKVARMLRVSAEEVAVTRNTSEGSNIIVKGVELKSGDEILITDHNHPSNGDSWKVRARRDGLVVKSLPTPAPARTAGELVSAFEKAITPRTRVIAITHLTSTTGVLYPAREIAALARKRGIYMHLDGAQTFGALDVNLQDIGCDSYSTSAHKWLMGPLEAGILYVRAERVGEVWPSIVTAGWSDQVTDARKLENYGQQDDPRLAGLDAALDFTNLVGIKTIEARVRWLASYFKEQAKAIRGVELKTNLEADLSHGVVKLSTGEANVKKHYDTLWERNRLSIASTPHGNQHGLRFSAHIYNTKDDVDRAVKALKDVVG